MLTGAAPLSGQENGPPDPLNPYELYATPRSESRLSATTIERIYLSYLTPRLNEIYAKYWEEENFELPEQGEVYLYPTPQHADGITIFFSIDEQITAQDGDLQQHRRLGRMFAHELQKYNRRPDSLHFFTAVDTARSTGEEVLSRLRHTRYLKPDRDGGEAFPDSTMLGNEAVSISAIELFLENMRLAVDDFKDDYELFLQYNGFRWQQDGVIEVQEHPYVQPGILIVFRITEEVAETDPGFTRHRRIAEDMQSQLDEIVERQMYDVNEAEFGVQVGDQTPEILD